VFREKESIRTSNILVFCTFFLFNAGSTVGPMANNSVDLFGSYAPTMDPKFTVTPLAGLASLATTTNYASGCGAEGNRCVKYNTSEIQHAVAGTELVVVCLGLGNYFFC
jgi:beta-glucosidase